MREVRRAAIQAQKNCKETLPRARRLTKEMMLYWKKYDKVEKEHRKRAEKEALEQRKLDEEMREVGLREVLVNYNRIPIQSGKGIQLDWSVFTIMKDFTCCNV